MPTLRPFIALALLTAGCSADSAVSAEDQLTLSAISGAEDYLARDFSGEEGSADMGGALAEPPLFRECDAEGEYRGLFSGYDADSDGELGRPEEEEVSADAAPLEGPPRDHLLGLLHLVYDVDGSGELDESERATLLDDFTARCEALHARLIADFDADGDGVLSEEEQAAAEAEIEPWREERHEELEECEGGAPPEGEGGPGGAPPEDGGFTDPLTAEFDADGSGDLDDAELAALRDEVRALIRDGAPPLPPPPGEPME